MQLSLASHGRTYLFPQTYLSISLICHISENYMKNQPNITSYHLDKDLPVKILSKFETYLTQYSSDAHITWHWHWLARKKDENDNAADQCLSALSGSSLVNGNGRRRKPRLKYRFQTQTPVLLRAQCKTEERKYPTHNLLERGLHQTSN